jgi:sulfonate transport system substrate-binding protein
MITYLRSLSSRLLAEVVINILNDAVPIRFASGSLKRSGSGLSTTFATVNILMPRFIFRILIGVSLGLNLVAEGFAGTLPSVLSIDYSERNPLSFVVKKFNLLEKEFNEDHVRIQWVYTPGSDFALKYLKADSLDVASVAGLSSVWFRANNGSIKSVYVFTRAECSSIMVERDSPIKSIDDLKGRKIAVELWTDPYFFLIRALSDARLHKSDVRIVSLQHAQGRMSMEMKCVDAWAARTPLSEMSQLEQGSRVICRNPFFNTCGLLDVKADFALKYPDAVTRIVRTYEKARKWALMHPDDFEAIYADEARLPLHIARLTLSRHDLGRPVFSRNDFRFLMEAVPVLKEENVVSQDTAVDKAINDMVDMSFVSKELRNCPCY